MDRTQLGQGRPIEATVDLAALAHNAREARRLADGRSVIAVVKADGYGHGALPIARTLLAAGCQRLAVVSVAEAVELRDGGIAAPLLVLGGVHDAAEAREARERALTVVLADDHGLELLAAAPGPEAARVHVEVDTGMRRMGVPEARASALLARAAGQPGLELEGVFTHLACADEAEPEPSLDQLRRLHRLLPADLRVPLVHAVNSAGLLAGGRGGPHEQAYAAALPAANAVRPGLMLYGAAPSTLLAAVAELRPVMTLRASVVALRRLEAGDAVGYGATWRAPRPTTIATLPAGYADGVPRIAGDRGHVWLSGERRPIVGRVSMDYVTVDVGDAPVALGDEAILFGPELPVEDAAEAAQTLAYELMVRVGSRVRRRWVGAADGDATAD